MQHAALEDMHVGMGALGHAVAAVEDRLVAARLHGALIGDDRRQQVDRLDVAVQKARVLQRDAPVRAVYIAHAVRTHPSP